MRVGLISRQSPTPNIASGQTLATNLPTAEGWLAALPAGVQGVILSVGTTGMAVAAILGLLLDNLIPGTLVQRGLDDPGVLVPEAGDVGVG